ncbi:MAG TPA: SAM-dependent chlorinase/fluorinase [Acidimicrobiales bacterium]|nr:SAM-dependent chlorinase/fluorinase [Acidimicrobiales bacterium]
MPVRAGGAVFLLTDYGYADEFAGVVRAVVVRHAPGAVVVDVSHGVAPYDVRGGALALARVVEHLGPGVVLAVVDPGVGTARRAVAVTVEPLAGRPYALVGPDNGLLPWALDALGGARRAVALGPSPLSAAASTFDGRDLFAPAAARLWQGSPLEDLGEELDAGGLWRLAPPRCAVSPGVVEAEVLWVDRFGNVQLAARPADAGAAGVGDEPADELRVEVGTRGHAARRVGAFADLDAGALGVVVDANGRLAVVGDRRSAATVLGVSPGDIVTLRAPRSPGGAP